MSKRTDPHLFYDRISNRYDRWSSGRVDTELRRRAVEALDLRAGDVVLVVGCGTGLDFAPLVQAVGPTGRVIGLDYSRGMLQHASSLIERNRWTNVSLMHADARKLCVTLLREHAGITEIDALLFSNVLTIVPDWTSVFERGFSLLRKGGRCAVLDVQPATGAARMINPLMSLLWRLGRANFRRPVAKLLTGKVGDERLFTMRTHFVASGVRR